VKEIAALSFAVDLDFLSTLNVHTLMKKPKVTRFKSVEQGDCSEALDAEKYIRI